ncbi:TIGR02808 family protein [Endozoicomonas sp. OPT23]|nr:TIGR02808 family protein [Endozoicomonas sp. OPT23]MRI34780.1 TIGR02808 family protein [Endozoicomonas sp. OPT23]
MSTLETIIWYTLGYMAMPVIFLTGFAITALIACFLVERITPES